VRKERDLKAFAKKAGYKIVDVWKDTASGRPKMTGAFIKKSSAS
jgi:hypothetical protein